jgi:hypothetical protein
LRIAQYLHRVGEACLMLDFTKHYVFSVAACINLLNRFENPPAMQAVNWMK